MRLISFFNKSCLICGSKINAAEQLCKPCIHKLPILVPEKLCKCCGIELFQSQALCGNCLADPPFFNETHALWAYDSLSSHLIQCLKFYEDFSVLPFLTASLAERLDEKYRNRKLPEVLIPVPIHTRRLIKRGFNQTDEIGKCLAKNLHIPFQNKLVYKVKPTTAQAALHVDDRSKNLRAAFKVKKQISVQSVALLDDVMTTGSTVNEIARILKQSGVKEVHVWVLARAMKVR